MKPHIIAGVDIGSSSVKMLAVQTREGSNDLEVLGLAEERSAGMRKGAVVNPEETAKKILIAKQRLEQVISQKISGVVVSLGGSHIFVAPSHGIVAVSRADGNISQEDVNRVLQAAQAFSLRSNTEILDIFPQQFIVDGQVNIKEPIGMRGVRLEVDVLAVCGFSPYIKNVTDAVLAAGLEIEDVVSTPLAASSAVLSQEDRELGACVVDIGAGTTGLAVFSEGDLVHVALFPVGSENITNDLAIGIRCDHEAAERIKIEFGACMGSQKKKMEKIDLPNGEQVTFSQKLVSQIIDARVREIFQLVNKELKKISKQGLLPAGIVLVGGGAKLPKIVECAKKELKLPARLGFPHGILVSEANPAFLGAMGLVIGTKEAHGVRPQETKLGEVFGKCKKLLKLFMP